MWFNSAIVYDLETKTSMLGDGIRDYSPYNPENFVVSIHWKVFEDLSDEAQVEADILKPVNTIVLRHVEKTTPDSVDEFRADMARVECQVAHNLKFDASWLAEMGFDLPEITYDTLIGEYIYARGNPIEKSLKATAERRDVSRKKSDLIDEEFKSGKEFSEIELAKVVEYAEADVQSCAEIMVQQLRELREEKNAPLLETFRLMNEDTVVLIEMERNGIAIDMDVLDQVGAEFQAEKDEHEKRLQEIVRDVMGDKPYNLNSGPDVNAVMYSREVVDKALWKSTFNLGTDRRGKPMYPPRMKPTQFTKEVRANTRVVKRTMAVHCHTCDGTGYIQKIKKDGTPYKNKSPCPVCDKQGALYQDTGVVAGLKLIPEGVRDTSVHGFKTDKQTIAKLIPQAKAKGNLVAEEFLTRILRLNAVNTYLDSFVKGIKTYTRRTGILHPQFNQTITRTGRLSSSQPNFQNQPKGHKFPVRKAIVSRFEGGKICEFDYSGLEFRVAGEISQDKQIIEDILTGKDVHKQTASIINQIPVSEVTKEQRQNAKAYTFAPLYGGRGANEEPHIRRYFEEYFVIYRGLAEWHQTLFTQVLDDGIVQIPSGRQYYFPAVKRIAGGRITNATNVVNYPVQGWATGCIVPLACVRAYRKFKELGLKSKLILTVHDSIVADVFPSEEQSVADALSWAMKGVADEAKVRWKYDFSLPLDIEGSIGPNWMEMDEMPLTDSTK